jgi:ferric-dicitrate binding protein FerR (iron transport regulator)
MATGPGDEPVGAGRDRLRAGHADREQVIGTLKAAFVQGMLAKDEFDARVSQAFASRTCAELAALTADLPAGLAAAASARPPAPARRRPMARAAARSGGCLVIAAAAVWGAGILDPGPFARSTAGPPACSRRT